LRDIVADPPRGARLLDVTLAAAGLVVLSPVLLVIAILIRLDDGGPVLYRQRRIGRGGAAFRIWKFRTMVVDAERRGGALTVAGDARVTRMGARLRRLKLDELPQLLNVVAGDMRLVGPRPEVPRYVDAYSDDQRRVLALVPGITDPASLAFIDEETLLRGVEDPERYYVEHVMPEKIRLNLAYAARATWWNDVRVIAATCRTLVATRTTAFDAPR
jgi:lipopolysaccharide/colanic/teichoic acid biosynthesis glycosyltransferase